MVYIKKVSVIIPLYNEENYIEECINSVINQTYKNIEIIIVDDNSTDNSLKILKNIKRLNASIKFFIKNLILAFKCLSNKRV